MDNLKMTTAAQVEQSKPQPQTQKLYEAPAIIYRALLEATAGSCTTYPGKTMGAPLCTIINS